MTITGRGLVSVRRCMALLVAFACTIGAADRVRADEPIEIFDAHMHYNWEPKPFYSVEEVLALFKKHRVTGILATSRPEVSLLIVRASDVPTYVEHGAADLGVAGKDVLLEHGGDGLYQPLDLGIGRCRMAVATRRGFDWAGTVQRGARIRVATKYLRTAREHFAAKGMHVDLIKLYGSMELAPLTGLADVIVDLVSTGNTLKANDLVEVETIMAISARLVVNPAALKLKRAGVQPLLERIAEAVAARAPAEVRA